MELISYCIIEGNDVNYTIIDKNITIIEYETSLSELSIIFILDIDGKEDFSSINNWHYKKRLVKSIRLE